MSYGLRRFADLVRKQAADTQQRLEASQRPCPLGAEHKWQKSVSLWDRKTEVLKCKCGAIHCDHPYASAKN